MARKIAKNKTVKKVTRRTRATSTIPMVETDFMVLVIVSVACFVLLGVAGYFLR